MLGFALGLSPGTGAARPLAVELRAAGPTSIQFSVAVPQATFELPLGAGGRARLALEGYQDPAAPGDPLLPRRVVMVAVPPVGEVRVRGSGQQPEIREGVRLAPQPWVPPGPGAQPRYFESPLAYQVAARPERARLLDVTWMRNQRVARIEIAPADYDPQGQRLVLYRHIDVDVEVSGGGRSGPPAESPDPFEGAYQDALVNYHQGLAWRRTAERNPGGPRFDAATVVGSSVFVGRQWVKIAVPHTGFYRVDYGVLRLLDLFGEQDSVAVDSLRLFTWPGYPVLAERDFCDTCDYREVAISVIDDNGRFDNNEDGVEFFALGASDWANLYDPARPDTVFVNHPYEAQNFYYLTISTAANPVPGTRRRIPAVSGAPLPGGGEIIPDTFTARAHFEIDTPAHYYPNASSFGSTLFWEKFFWHILDVDGTFAVNFDLPGADTTQAARLRLRMWGIASFRDTACTPYGVAAHETRVTVNSLPVSDAFWGSRFNREGMTPLTVDVPVTALRTTGNSLRVEIPDVNCVDQQAFAWFDFFYPRRFQPIGGVLNFDSPSGAGNYLYRVGPFSTSARPRIFDVTDAYAPAEITNAGYASETGGHFLSFEIVQAGARRYRVVQDTSIVELTGESVVMATQYLDPVNSRPLDLRDSTTAGKYVVIYYDGFQQAAAELGAWRRDFNHYSVVTVPISALYDQFSGGRTDPAAIRDMLRAAFVNWQEKPTFVTLLGDASYDFKNYKGEAGPGQPGTLVPSFENNFDTAVIRQYATDDWLLNVVDRAGDTGAVPDFFGARLPARDAASALDMVRNKVLFYERGAPLGEYRNRVMFIADDDKQGSLDDPLEWQHVSQTSSLERFYTPLHMDRVYVYLHTYPSEDFTKPAAKEDILRNLDRGVALFNYIGHGSPFQLSDERVFVDQDVSSLRNAQVLPLFVAASCDVGKFSDPVVNSIGELLVSQPGGGAIGVISATEIAFSGQNATLNRSIYTQLFSRDSTGQYRVPISEALLRGKLEGDGAVNSQKYQLLGDAATVLNLPHLWVDVTLYDSAGVDTVSTLRQGQIVTFRGRVLDRPGGTLVEMDGVTSVLIEDSAPIIETPNCIPPCVNYFYYPGTMFRGDAEVRQGLFEGRFVVPIEARQGNRGRFRGYANRMATAGAAGDDAVGNRTTTIVAGVAPTNDHDGPRVSLSFKGGSTVVRPDAVLEVLLHDPSGILTTGHSPQNGIIVTIDGNSNTREDISGSFRYAAGSYQSGTALYEMAGIKADGRPRPRLAPGPHTITVSAADNLASGFAASEHRSSATILFEVQESPPLDITRALLFPNPVSSGGSGGGGQFVIDAPGDPVNVLLRIYTVSGRLIRTLKAFGGQRQIQIPWDGLDAEGQSLANGVYLFKVNVNVREADGSSSARQRADAEGRFVVARH